MANKNEVLSSIVKKVKLHSAGEKIKKVYDMPTVGYSKDGMRFPTLYLNTKNVPALKGYEVEDECVLVIKGKVMSHSLREDTKNSNENFDIEVKEIGLIKKK